MFHTVLCAFSPSTKSDPTSKSLPIYKGVPSFRAKREKMDKAATTIQKIVRGYLLRQTYRMAYENRMKEAKARREENRRKMEKVAKDWLLEQDTNNEPSFKEEVEEDEEEFSIDYSGLEDRIDWNLEQNMSKDH